MEEQPAEEQPAEEQPAEADDEFGRKLINIQRDLKRERADDRRAAETKAIADAVQRDDRRFLKSKLFNIISGLSREGCVAFVRICDHLHAAAPSELEAVVQQCVSSFQDQLAGSVRSMTLKMIATYSFGCMTNPDTPPSPVLKSIYRMACGLTVQALSDIEAEVRNAAQDVLKLLTSPAHRPQEHDSSIESLDGQDVSSATVIPAAALPTGAEEAFRALRAPLERLMCSEDFVDLRTVVGLLLVSIDEMYREPFDADERDKWANPLPGLAAAARALNALDPRFLLPEGLPHEGAAVRSGSELARASAARWRSHLGERSSASLRYLKLHESDEEYVQAAALLHKSLPDASQITVWRIDHPHAHLYHRELGRISNEKLLWHSPSASDPLMNIESDYPFHPTFSSGGSYGRGSYFSEHAIYGDRLLPCRRSKLDETTNERLPVAGDDILLPGSPAVYSVQRVGLESDAGCCRLQRQRTHWR